MTFSVVVLDGLERLGVQVSDDEKRGWLHLWNVVGHFLGIRPDLIPKDVDDGHELMEAIRDRQWRWSQDGVDLTRPLVELMQGYFPGTALDGFPVAMIRLLSGDHCGDLLGLPPSDWTKNVVEIMAELERYLTAGDPNEVSRRLIDSMMFGVMKMVVSVEREGKPGRFRIPDSLTNTIDPKF